LGEGISDVNKLPEPLQKNRKEEGVAFYYGMPRKPRQVAGGKIKSKVMDAPY